MTLHLNPLFKNMFKLKCLIKNFKLKNISSLVVEYVLLQDTKDKKNHLSYDEENIYYIPKKIKRIISC
jgi:hypothetical protein